MPESGPCRVGRRADCPGCVGAGARLVALETRDWLKRLFAATGGRPSICYSNLVNLLFRAPVIKSQEARCSQG